MLPEFPAERRPAKPGQHVQGLRWIYCRIGMGIIDEVRSSKANATLKHHAMRRRDLAGSGWASAGRLTGPGRGVAGSSASGSASTTCASVPNETQSCQSVDGAGGRCAMCRERAISCFSRIKRSRKVSRTRRLFGSTSIAAA